MSNSTMPMKKRDLFQEGLRQLSDWVVDNAKWIFGVIVLAAVIGAGAAIWSQISHSKELDWQSRYFVIEKQIVDRKQAFDEAAKAGPKATLVVTGDLEKDYGNAPKELADLIEAAPGTKAAEMAALNLAELQIRYKKTTEAGATLQKVNTSDRVSDLLGALVVNMRAGIAADQGECAKAVPMWETITRNHRARFLHEDAKLQMGLCYEQMNEFAKAEQVYNELLVPSGNDMDATATKEAERYLRLLKLKKTSGT